MVSLSPRGEPLSMKSKFTRLAARMRDPEWRRYGFVMASGKLLGLATVMVMMILIPLLLNGTSVRADVPPSTPPAAVATAATAVAAPAPAPAPAPPVVLAKDIVNPLNTVWTLIAAFLVFAMQVGFVMLEAGFCAR